MIQLTYTDGGRNIEGFLNETNDCSVRALSLSTGVSYTKAHDLLKTEGRRDRKGSKLPMIKNSLHSLIVDHVIVDFQELVPSAVMTENNRFYGTSPRRPTLQSIVDKYPTGRYLIIVTGHALAMIDGVIHDKGEVSGPRTRVRNVFRITLPVPAADVKNKEVAWQTLMPLAPNTSFDPAVSVIPNQEQINELWARLDRLENKR
jgi:hypothetical protein